jgi:type II secretory pathway pseudopilin PulG
LFAGVRDRIAANGSVRENAMSDRRGLSRVEVLVVLLILSLTAALLLVGITRVRQTADAMMCQDNLRRLGIAVHGYRDSMGHLPHLVDQCESSPTGQGLSSAFHHLTPYIEAWPNLYRGHHSPPSKYHAHSSVPFAVVEKDGTPGTTHGGDANYHRTVFLDPADTTAQRLRDVQMTLPDGSTGYYATGSYAANGLMPWGVRKLPVAFPGGMASVILIAERPQICRTSEGTDLYNLWGVGFYSPHMPAFATLTPSELPGLESTGQIAPVLDKRMVRIGRQDSSPSPPDFASPIQLIRKGQPCDPRLPGTPHKSGMQAVMGDGSVKVFGRGTDPWVFWAACEPGTK